MIYILLMIMLWMFAYSLHKSQNDLIKPAIVITTTFSFAIFMAALYTNTWNLPMHSDTAFLIVLQIAIFLFGCWLADKAFAGKKIDSKIKIPQYNLKWQYFAIILALVLFCLYLNYLEMSGIAHKYSNTNDLGAMLAICIRKFLDQTEKFSRWYGFRFNLVKSICFVSAYALVCNVLNRAPAAKIIKFLLITFMFIPLTVLSTGRQQFVYLAIYFITISAILYQRMNCYSRKSMEKMIVVITCAFCVFFSAFYAVGTINGKIKSTNNPLRVLSHYAGTNINAFDVFLHKKYPDNEYIGSTTLTDVYSKLHMINPDIPKFRMYITEFTVFDGITTNVYTAMRRYVQDYGYFGCTVIMFLLGLSYTFVYNWMKYYSKSGLAVICYGVYVYPIFMLFREERFMNEIIAYRSLLALLLLSVLFYGLKKLGEDASDE